MAMRNEGKLDAGGASISPPRCGSRPPTSSLLYNAAEMHCSLGEVLLAKARVQEAAEVLEQGGGA